MLVVVYDEIDESIKLLEEKNEDQNQKRKTWNEEM